MKIAFSLLLNSTRHTHIAIKRAKEGLFDCHDIKGVGLFGKYLGILGPETIGSHMAHIGKGMGMKLLAWSRTKPPVVDELGIEFTSDLEYLLAKSDLKYVCVIIFYIFRIWHTIKKRRWSVL